MTTKLEFPRGLSLWSIKLLIYLAQKEHPGCRPGQAVCNKYNVPKHIEDEIWEATKFNFVAIRLNEIS